MLLKKSLFFAAVRSDEQASALSKLGATVLQLELTNETDVAEIVARHDSREPPLSFEVRCNELTINHSQHCHPYLERYRSKDGTVSHHGTQQAGQGQREEDVLCSCRF